MRGTARLLVGFAIGVLTPASAFAQDAAAFYEENCAACHTIGGGPQAGPDLKGVTARRDRDWLIRFLIDTDAFASDPAVLKMIEEAGGLEMPATPGMTPGLADAILRLIEKQSGEVEDARAAPELTFTPADAARGRGLFLGTTRLTASGPPCVGCHEARHLPAPGGRLGPNLAAAQERLGGSLGLTSWLAGMPTPMMRALYRETPLSTDEARALAAFLGEAAQPEAPADGLAGFITAGGAAAAVVLVVIGVAGSKRFRAVRRPLVGRRPADRPPLRHAPGASAFAAASSRSDNPGGSR